MKEDEISSFLYTLLNQDVR